MNVKTLPTISMAIYKLKNRLDNRHKDVTSTKRNVRPIHKRVISCCMWYGPEPMLPIVPCKVPIHVFQPSHPKIYKIESNPSYHRFQHFDGNSSGEDNNGRRGKRRVWQRSWRLDPSSELRAPRFYSKDKPRARRCL